MFRLFFKTGFLFRGSKIFSDLGTPSKAGPMADSARKASTFQAAAVCSGILLKKTSGITKHYKKRYVELGGHYLRVWQEQDAATASPDTLKESIDINGIESLSCHAEDLSISLELDTEAVLEFKAEDQPTFEKWEAALTGAIQIVGSNEHFFGNHKLSIAGTIVRTLPIPPFVSLAPTPLMM
jgi:hypothetical protein